MKQPEYCDDYPTCLETFSTLRIFSEKLEPAAIEKALKLTSTSSFKKGEPYGKVKPLFRKANGWFYETKNLTKSRDTRRHIDLILKALNTREKAVKMLLKKGCTISIVSFWLSGHAAGGPALWPYQMLKLGKLGIEIWWDIYFHEE
jgi:hypothetical protein